MKLFIQWILAAACACTVSLGQEATVRAQSVAVITDRFSSPAGSSPAGSSPAGSAANAVDAVLPVSNPGISALPELASDGYWIDSAPINEVFQYLARAAGSQYYYNNELNGPQYNVTGHLKLSNPKKQMEELAVGYGLAVHEQGSTVYLMTEAQLSRLPVEVMCYPLKYLRGAHPGGNASRSAEGEGSGGTGMADFEKLKSIIKPLLTHDSGQIEFEEKTNVLLVTDNSVKLQRVHDLLEQLDRPKQQIAINVRILRVRKAHGSKVGVDWTGILGDGLPIKASQSLNALFNLPNASQLTKAMNMTQNLGSSFATNATIAGGVPAVTSSFGRTEDTSSTNTYSRTRDYTDGAGLVFDALQMEAIVHALNDKNIVSQESCPTIITEDNEQGIISIVDRFPVITSNVTATTAGQTTTDEVRYKIDEKDPDASHEPEKSREIGVTLSVTPTLLPDGTVRMKLRPRVANIVELVPGKSGNVFPRVSESTIEGISRIPNGQSLFLGGFYDSTDNHQNAKVPVLGSLPLLSHLFSYKNKNSEQISLVFIITPKVYDASNYAEAVPINRQTRWNSGFNRSNPDAPVTPLLPEPSPYNNNLPVPADRESVEVAPLPLAAETSKAPRPQVISRTTPRRTWFGRLFVKEEAPARR